MMFQIIGAMAELERSLIRVNDSKLAMMRDQGASWREIAACYASGLPEYFVGFLVL
jgi:hypothetical protein